MGSRVLGCAHSLDNVECRNIWRLSTPETDPAMCDVIGLHDFVSETVLDIRDLPKLTSLVSSIAPDIIIHMAAQSLVSAGYSDPVNTFSTNIMGTVNLLEAKEDSSI